MSEDVFKKKEVILGVTGGIAAYKVPLLVRNLKKEGFSVQVVMTRHAVQFVTPLTLATLSGAPVLTQMFESESPPAMAHIDVPRKADLMAVVPATANIIAKMANGIADDLLSTMLLAVTSPLLVVPAMNTRMYHHPAVLRNLQTLRERGVRILEPGMGDLACGEQGVGRMVEIETILDSIRALLRPAGPLTGKRVLVTAGPTLEPIDPVRYIGNRSSGKMGFALARVAEAMGGRVTLVSGPVMLPVPDRVSFVSVETAREMQDQVARLFPETDLLIMAAAVSDFRMETPVSDKIKRGSGKLTLQMTENPDILRELTVRRKRKNQILVGFAAETGNLRKKAEAKLRQKGVDFLVANDVSGEETGFGSDKNRVLMLDRLGGVEKTDLLPKEEVARKILERVCRIFLRDAPAASGAD